MISALAGIVFTLPLRLARAPTTATGLELSVVAVVLLGGVSIFGGRGHLLGVIAAVLLLGTLRNALTLNDVSAEVLTIVTGQPAAALRPRPERHRPRPRGAAPRTRRRPTPNPTTTSL